MALWVKDPVDDCWFQFGWSLFLDPGETITSYTVTVDTPLTKEADTSIAQAVNFKVSGGANGQEILAYCTVNTSSGNLFTDKKTIFIVERVAE